MIIPRCVGAQSCPAPIRFTHLVRRSWRCLLRVDVRGKVEIQVACVRVPLREPIDSAAW